MGFSGKRGWRRRRGRWFGRGRHLVVAVRWQYMRVDLNRFFGEGRGFEIVVVGHGGLEDQFVAM